MRYFHKLRNGSSRNIRNTAAVLEVSRTNVQRVPCHVSYRRCFRILRDTAMPVAVRIFHPRKQLGVLVANYGATLS